MIDIKAMQDSYVKHNINKIQWISSEGNIADGLTEKLHVKLRNKN